jgi:hypothetical protein
MCILKDSINPVHINIFYKHQIIIFIAQFQDIITVNCQALTCCMNVSYVIQGVHSAGLSNVWGVSQNVMPGDAMGSPGKLKSFIR